MKVSKAIGKMSCLCCGELITVKQADTGTVSVSCPDCDFSGYAKAGTESHRHIMAKVILKTIHVHGATVPTIQEKTVPTPKPAPAMPSAAVIKKNTVFG